MLIRKTQSYSLSHDFLIWETLVVICQSTLTSNVPVYKDLTSLTLWILASDDGFMKNRNMYHVLYNKILSKIVVIDGILFYLSILSTQLAVSSYDYCRCM